jgi:hypothetical protein
MSKNNWKGGRSITPQGYVSLRLPSHHRANPQGRVKEHIVIAENMTGIKIVHPIVIHHVNENRSDNRPRNLVICENTAYHNLLHQRIRSLAASGHADYLKCRYCKRYSPPSEVTVCGAGEGKNIYHPSCSAANFRAKMLGGRVWRDIVKARERSARYKAKKRLERKA